MIPRDGNGSGNGLHEGSGYGDSLGGNGFGSGNALVSGDGYGDGHGRSSIFNIGRRNGDGGYSSELYDAIVVVLERHR